MRGDEIGDRILYSRLVTIVEQHVPVLSEAAIPIRNVRRNTLVAVVAVNKQHIVRADIGKLPALAVSNNEIHVAAFAGRLEYLL